MTNQPTTLTIARKNKVASGPSFTRLPAYLLLLIVFIACVAEQEAFATHLRGGFLRWQKEQSTPNDITVRFQVMFAFPQTEFSNPQIDDIVPTPLAVVSMDFGDGNGRQIEFWRIRSINVDENWVVAEALNSQNINDLGFLHTYLNGTYTATVDSQARIGGLNNRAGGTYHYETKLDVNLIRSSGINASPDILFDPLYYACAPSHNFTIIYGSLYSVQWRLSTDGEATGNGSTATTFFPPSTAGSPAGITVIGNQVTLNPNNGGNQNLFWTAQVIATAGDFVGGAFRPIASTPIDFIVKLGFPPAPPNLTASGTGPVDLQWNAAVSAERYWVQRRSFSVCGDPSSVITLTDNLMTTGYHDDTVLPPGVHEYRVAAKNGCGWGPFRTVEVIVQPQPPYRVTDLFVIGQQIAQGLSDTTVTLSWSPARFADSYTINLYRSGLFHEQIPNITTTTYTYPTPVASINAFSFEVFAVNANGPGCNSETALLPTIPEISYGLEYNTKIDLHWSCVPNAVIQVRRMTTPPPQLTTIATVTGPSTNWLDTALVNDLQQYFYRIVAIGQAAESWSTELIHIPRSAAGSAATPIAPFISAAPGPEGTVRISWGQAVVSGGYYVVQRKSTPFCAFKPIAEITQTEYIDNDIADGLNPYYMVAAVAPGGTGSRHSGLVQGQFAPNPLAPSNLTADPDTEGGKVILTWTDNSQAEQGYRIYRRHPSESMLVLVGEVGPNVTTFTHSGLPPQSQWVYSVRSFIGYFISTSSNEETITTPPLYVSIYGIADAEEPGTPGSFVISRNGYRDSELEILYEVTSGSGANASGDDYLPLGSGNILAGQLSRTITVTPVNDNLVEPNENLYLQLIPEYYEVDEQLAMIEIRDDDKPIVSVFATVPDAQEPIGAPPSWEQQCVFTISRINYQAGTPKPQMTVHFTMSGTAANNEYTVNPASAVTLAAGTDWASVTVTFLDDPFYETNETAVLTITPNANYLVGTASVAVTNNSFATFLPRPGDNLASARGVSEGRLVVGLSTIAPYNTHNYRAAIWGVYSAMSWKNIPAGAVNTPSSLYSAYANAIGGFLTIVGVGWQSGNGANGGFVSTGSASGYSQLLPPFVDHTSIAYGVNNYGPGGYQWIVGVGDVGNSAYRACYWRFGTIPPALPPVDLGTPSGDNLSWALGVNDNNAVTPIIVGQSSGPNGYKPLVWRTGQGSLRVLPLLSGNTDGTARDVNNWGVIVGSIWNPASGIARGVYWTYNSGTDSYMATPLAAPSTPADFSSYPLRINESGHIVGYSDDSVHGFRAVRWDADGIHFLDTELGAGPDLRFIAAYDINVNGDIVGEVEESSVKKGFLLSR